MKTQKIIPSAGPAARVTPIPEPSLLAIQVAGNIRFAPLIGRSDTTALAALVDHTTRFPQLDDIARAADELLAVWPGTAGRRSKGTSRSLHHCSVKLARALQSLADQDGNINPHTMQTIKHLCS